MEDIYIYIYIYICLGAEYGRLNRGDAERGQHVQLSASVERI